MATATRARTSGSSSTTTMVSSSRDQIKIYPALPPPSPVHQGLGHTGHNRPTTPALQTSITRRKEIREKIEKEKNLEKTREDVDCHSCCVPVNIFTGKPSPESQSNSANMTEIAVLVDDTKKPSTDHNSRARNKDVRVKQKKSPSKDNVSLTMSTDHKARVRGKETVKLNDSYSSTSEREVNCVGGFLTLIIIGFVIALVVLFIMYQSQSHELHSLRQDYLKIKSLFPHLNG